jgi:murein DD-endopeptidase MepM/ murein hydrolase activator NlpD
MNIQFNLLRPIVIERHVAAFVLMFGIMLVLAGIAGSDPVEARRATATIELESPSKLHAPLLRAQRNGGNPTPAEKKTGATAQSANWIDQVVKRGDNLSLVFGRAGASSTALQQILSAAHSSDSLRSIFPGQVLSFQINENGELLSLRFQRSPVQSTIFSRTKSGFSRNEAVRTPDIRHAFRHAELTSSLFNAGKEAGISPRVLMELADVFGGVIDFALDPRRGDTLSVLFEEKYLDGEKIGEGDIVAVEFVNAGRRYSAFRYFDSDGNEGYFGEDGTSMKRSFLRAPLDFTRVSSNFNMRRFHPIMKVVRPHRGVDYSAPTGTPVYASGDGRVVESSYSRSTGNYITIQHYGEFKTRYLHLHKRSVKVGQRVSQGQTIGRVGATGLATGPHLHYEFLVRGVHHDPRKVLDNLPRTARLPKTELPRFQQDIAGVKHQLATYTRAWNLAVSSSKQHEG